MAKLSATTKTSFICQQCGWSGPRWQGQCGGCGAWNTLVEETQSPVSAQRATSAQSIKLAQINPLQNQQNRISTQIGELDRVLGGEKVFGILPGAVMLVGGSPGVGKSTLMTQVVLNLLTHPNYKNAAANKILYVAGEESPEQISLRIKRINSIEQYNIKPGKSEFSQVGWAENLIFLPSHDIEQIISSIIKFKPNLVVIDSIQTITTAELSGGAGSIGQVRECADRLTNVAKQYNIPLFLIGHITKDGKLAGPMVLEHIVDVVLEMTGESQSQLRLIRTKKNRFGSTDEVGVLQMTEKGLIEIKDPSLFFLDGADHAAIGAAGSCVVEGSRPLLVEVQALVVSSKLAVPRRIARGVSNTKLQLICAVLEKHCRLPLGGYDVYCSLAGGLSSADPGLDLAIAGAIASSYFNRALKPKLQLVGEISLLGEVRPAGLMQKRIKEAQRLKLEPIFKKEVFRHSLVAVLNQLGLSKTSK
ncbi:MAG TPA: DNA repair protein RadA [Candidatus Woesebacteria bacterium]|nr:DNA repair protein RadA [Candidatus Woesebacteria bacterium]